MIYSSNPQDFSKFLQQNDSTPPTTNGNTLQCPHCHKDTGIPLITGEVLYADKRCPFCGEIVVYAHLITC